MRKLSIACICLMPCLAQQTRLNYSGVITGTLRGDDGTAIVGGHVSLALLPPHAKRLRQTDWATTSGAGGAFQFRGLDDGRYRLCAQAPKSSWLNPCEWGSPPLIIMLSRTEPIINMTLEMKKGAAVPIRLDDPGELLSQHEAKTRGAYLLMGVGNSAFAFIPAAVVSRDAKGRTHQILIPFNTLTRLMVYSPFFQLTDSVGMSLPRTQNVAIPVTILTGQQPPTITLRVTGGGQP